MEKNLLKIVICLLLLVTTSVVSSFNYGPVVASHVDIEIF